jgi:hypothetical protein
MCVEGCSYVIFYRGDLFEALWVRERRHHAACGSRQRFQLTTVSRVGG